jgi:hypothetical protein
VECPPPPIYAPLVTPGAIISFCDDGKQPTAEVVLANGDHVQLVLSRDGLAITGPGGAVLFHGTPEVVSQICAGLVSSTATQTPLGILLAIIVQLGSAGEVRDAFSQAAADLT